MNISPDILRRDTVALIKQIDWQIDEVKGQAEVMGIQPYQLRNSDGTWPMVSLLQAKAQAYNTLVLLQQKK